MTREEAIKKLQRQKAEYLDKWVDFSGIAEAFDMAIRALKNEQTDGDLISRDYVLSKFKEQCDRCGMGTGATPEEMKGEN